MDSEEDFEAQWRLVETGYRKALEEYLVGAKVLFRKESLLKKKNSPSLIPLKVVYFDVDYKIPLAVYEYEMLGTRQELLRLIEVQHRELTTSAQYRKNQNRMFNRLKDEFGMKDKDILDLLIPDASADERAIVYKRFKQDRGRKMRARRATKS